MKYSLRSLMIVVTLACVGLAVVQSRENCDGVLLLNGKPAYECSIYFWRENGEDLDEFVGRTDEFGRYTLRQKKDGSSAPPGRYIVEASTAYRANPKLWKRLQEDSHIHFREVTVSSFGFFSHRIPSIEFDP